MPKDTKQELLDDFSGGLNTRDPSHKVAKNYSPYMRNVIIDNGKLERISGYQTLGSTRTLSKVTGIFPFVRETGQTTFLVTDSSLTLETSDFKTWVAISSTSNTSTLLYWMQVRNKMWGFNGVDPVITWDGTTKVILNGSNGTPNVPRFRYGAYYLDRVFGFGVPNAGSDLYFSATISTDNIIIAPDNQFAWINSNFLVHVGQGDGQIGTALWIYQGLLRAGKEQSIYTIYGDNQSNFKPQKEEANVGVVSNDSVRVMDGDSHLLGQTGVYRNVKRISDTISPDILNINRGISGILSNGWDSQMDFLKGQFFGSTATPGGFVTLISTSYGFCIGVCGQDLQGGKRYVFPDGAVAGANAATENLQLDPATTFYGPIQISFSASNRQIPDTAKVYLNEVLLPAKPHGALGCGLSFATMTVVNRTNGEMIQSTITPVDSPADGYHHFPFFLQNPLIDGLNINNSSLSIKIDGCNIALDGFVFQPVPRINLNFITATTGQYISDVTTLTSVTAWGNYDANQFTNGGSIAHYFRTSTSAVNITTKTWANIAPGVVIQEPTINNFIQWATTITGIGFVQAPALDNVTISHLEGQVSDARAFAIEWNNRYWLTVTTTTNNNLRLTYIKSRTTNSNPNAWMAIEGYPIDCYAKAGDILYGGSVSTGAVYRLDYGTNFDGAPIDSIYDTPDMPLGDYFFDKGILKYIVDGSKSIGGTLSVKRSENGTDFVSSTFTISGTGRFSHIIEGVADNVKTLRLRLENKELDIGLGINNVNILYQSLGVLSNK